MRRLLISRCVALLLLATTPAIAERSFPPAAKRGELKAHEYPRYQIGKAIYRISAGGKIFNELNMIIMPVSLQKQKAQVMYLIDMNGNLSALWLLTKAEAAKHPLPKPTAAEKRQEEEARKKAEAEKKRLEEEQRKKNEAAAGNG